MRYVFLLVLFNIYYVNMASARSVTQCVAPGLFHSSYEQTWTPSLSGDPTAANFGGYPYLMYSVGIVDEDLGATINYPYVKIDAYCGLDNKDASNVAILDTDFTTVTSDGDSVNCYCKMTRPYATPWFRATSGLDIINCAVSCSFHCNQFVENLGTLPDAIILAALNRPNPGSDIIAGTFSPDKCEKSSMMAIERQGLGLSSDCNETGGVYGTSIIGSVGNNSVCFNSTSLLQSCYVVYGAGYSGSDDGGNFEIKSGVCNEL